MIFARWRDARLFGPQPKTEMPLDPSRGHCAIATPAEQPMPLKCSSCGFSSAATSPIVRRNERSGAAMCANPSAGRSLARQHGARLGRRAVPDTSACGDRRHRCVAERATAVRGSRACSTSILLRPSIVAVEERPPPYADRVERRILTLRSGRWAATIVLSGRIASPENVTPGWLSRALSFNNAFPAAMRRICLRIRCRCCAAVHRVRARTQSTRARRSLLMEVLR
jgi:hypothetical protein